eukprot:362331-Chlamydomonas_euryale.AAC.2
MVSIPVSGLVDQPWPNRGKTRALGKARYRRALPMRTQLNGARHARACPARRQYSSAAASSTGKRVCTWCVRDTECAVGWVLAHVGRACGSFEPKRRVAHVGAFTQPRRRSGVVCARVHRHSSEGKACARGGGAHDSAREARVCQRTSATADEARGGQAHRYSTEGNGVPRICCRRHTEQSNSCTCGRHAQGTLPSTELCSLFWSSTPL